MYHWSLIWQTLHCLIWQTLHCLMWQTLHCLIWQTFIQFSKYLFICLKWHTHQNVQSQILIVSVNKRKKVCWTIVDSFTTLSYYIKRKQNLYFIVTFLNLFWRELDNMLLLLLLVCSCVNKKKCLSQSCLTALWCHCDVTLMSLWCQFDVSLMSHWCQFDVTLISLDVSYHWCALHF